MNCIMNSTVSINCILIFNELVTTSTSASLICFVCFTKKSLLNDRSLPLELSWLMHAKQQLSVQTRKRVFCLKLLEIAMSKVCCMLAEFALKSLMHHLLIAMHLNTTSTNVNRLGYYKMRCI